MAALSPVAASIDPSAAVDPSQILPQYADIWSTLSPAQQVSLLQGAVQAAVPGASAAIQQIQAQNGGNVGLPGGIGSQGNPTQDQAIAQDENQAGDFGIGIGAPSQQALNTISAAKSSGALPQSDNADSTGWTMGYGPNVGQNVPGTVGPPLPANLQPSGGGGTLGTGPLSQSPSSVGSPNGTPSPAGSPSTPYTPAQGTATLASAPTPYSVSQVGAPPTPQAYFDAVQQSYQPYFDASQQQLEAELASKGILGSGAGSKGLQDLTAYNNATLENATAPLIAQGFSQQAAANTANAAANNTQGQTTYAGNLQTALANSPLETNASFTNAGATNTALSSAQQIANQLLQQQNSLGLQGQEYNAGLQSTYDLANQNASNTQTLAQEGYANQDYLNALNELYGLTQSGLGTQGSILSSSLNGQINGYNNTNTTAGAAGAAIGSAPGNTMVGPDGLTYQYDASTGSYIPSSTQSTPYNVDQQTGVTTGNGVNGPDQTIGSAPDPNASVTTPVDGNTNPNNVPLPLPNPQP